MLVLTRQKNESIMIGDDVEFTIVEIRGDKVRIGITAPLDIPVYRKEIYVTIQRENIEAAKAPKPDLKKVEEMLRDGLKKRDSEAETGD